VDRVFPGTCHNGQIMVDPAVKSDWQMNLAILQDEECEFIARKKKKKKSNKQNRYYRGVVVPYVAKAMGETDDRAHGYLQLEFFVYEDDQGRKYIRSTRLEDWETIEWEEKMSEIRQWASEFLNMFLPKPNEVDFY